MSPATATSSAAEQPRYYSYCGGSFGCSWSSDTRRRQLRQQHFICAVAPAAPPSASATCSSAAHSAARVLFSNKSALCSSNSSLCFSGPASASAAAPPALHQRCGQHCNISDGLQTAPIQNHPVAHLGVSISVSCSNLGEIEATSMSDGGAAAATVSHSDSDSRRPEFQRWS